MKIDLGDLPLFASLNASKIQTLLKSMTQQEFKAGDYIIKQGTKGDTVFILAEGKVAVTTHSKDGMQSHILFHEAPSLFGDIEIWSERPYLGNVVAIEPCLSYRVDKPLFLKLLHSNHQAAIAMIQFLANQIYTTGTDTRIRLFGNVEHVVANALCYLAVMYGEKREMGTVVSRPPSKTDLAQMIGIARRSVIRAMAALERAGLIRMDENHLVIPSMEKLREKMQEALG